MIAEIYDHRVPTPFQISCWLYAQILLLYPQDLYFRYGEEMYWVFQEQLREAAAHGAVGYFQLWYGVLLETGRQLGRAAALRLGILGIATFGATCMMIVPAILVRPVRFPRLDIACDSKVYASTKPASAAERMMTVAPGVRVQVLDWGGTGRPLLFLAGLGSDAHVYDGFAPKFTSGFHVYGMTRRGFGASDKPAPTPQNYAADRLGDDVVAVIDALHLEHPVLIGHSIAGEELSSVGSRHPERVAGLIYLDAGDGYAIYDKRHGDWQIDMNEMKQRLNAIASGAPVDQQTLTSLQQSTKRLDRSSGEVMQQFALMPPSGTFPAIPAVALAIRHGEQKYISVGVPALAIFACPHNYGPLFGSNITARRRMEAFDNRQCSAQSEAFQAAIPKATVVKIPNASHFVFLSNPEEVTTAMESFLNRLPEQ